METAPLGLPDGYVVPVHRALTEHILLGGAPRGLAIANATLAAAIGLGLRLWFVFRQSPLAKKQRHGLGNSATPAHQPCRSSCCI
jgi:hypothetical protein